MNAQPDRVERRGANPGADLARKVGDAPNIPKLVEVLKRHGVNPALPPPSS